MLVTYYFNLIIIKLRINDMFRLSTATTIIFYFALNIVYAGCGSCNISNKNSEIPTIDFVTSINENGAVKGLVLASCGMCNFGMKKNRKCSLAIQIDEKSYNVKGSGIEDHGDSHAKDGFCNAVRIAKVSGQIKNNIFLSELFELQKE